MITQKLHNPNYVVFAVLYHFLWIAWQCKQRILKIQLFVFKCNEVAIFWFQSIDAVLGSLSVDVDWPILPFLPIDSYTTDHCNYTTEWILLVCGFVARVLKFGFFQNFIDCGTLWDITDWYCRYSCYQVCHVKNKLNVNCDYLERKIRIDINSLVCSFLNLPKKNPRASQLEKTLPPPFKLLFFT